MEFIHFVQCFKVPLSIHEKKIVNNVFKNYNCLDTGENINIFRSLCFGHHVGLSR